MIGTIRHHQKWLWAVVIVLTIASFLLFFSPSQRLGNNGQTAQDFGTVNGRRITQTDMQNARAEVELLYFLRTGNWPDSSAQRNGFDLDRETYARLALIGKISDLKLKPTADAAANWIKETFGSTNGVFPMDRFNDFIKAQLTPRKLTAEDFSRFARHQVAQQHLISVYGLAGKLATERDVETFYRELNESFVTEVALFSASNYVSSVEVTPALVGNYFTNNASDYRLPDRLQVNYIEWDLTNFHAIADQELAKNTNLTRQIEMAYLKSDTNSLKDASGKVLSPEAAKSKMKDDYRKSLAQNEAAKKANDFLTELANGHDDSHPFSVNDMEKLAKKKGLEVKTTPPFSQRDMLKLKLSPQFVQTALQLRDNSPDDPGRERLYALRPIPGDKAIYAIGFKKLYPSEIQSFETVRSEVEKDYREDQALKLARDAGVAFERTLTNGLAQGKTFEAIAKGEKVKPVTLPHFSLGMDAQANLDLPGKLSLDSLQGATSTLTPGHASPFVGLSDGGYILFLKSKTPVEDTKMKTEFPEFLNRQRDQRMIAAFSEWFQKVVQESVKVPVKDSPDKS